MCCCQGHYALRSEVDGQEGKTERTGSIARARTKQQQQEQENKSTNTQERQVDIYTLGTVCLPKIMGNLVSMSMKLCYADVTESLR